MSARRPCYTSDVDRKLFESREWPAREARQATAMHVKRRTTSKWLAAERLVSTAFDSPLQSATKGADHSPNITLKMTPSSMSRRPWSTTGAALLCLLLSTCAAATDDAAAASSTKVNTSNKKCQTLHTSMTYSQDKAPRDISAVVSFETVVLLVI